MTREEAIEILKAHHMWTGEPQEIIDVRKENKALDMAIQALSQEPTDENLHREREQAYMQGYEDASKRFRQEPCDDLISRKDAEQMFRNIRSHLKPQDYKSAEEFNTRDLMLLNAEQMIHALPSVTQKSGKWILLDECANSGYYCSNCQKKLVKEGWSQTVKKIKYCPNCGAKMVEPQESEEE